MWQPQQGVLFGVVESGVLLRATFLRDDVGDLMIWVALVVLHVIGPSWWREVLIGHHLFALLSRHSKGVSGYSRLIPASSHFIKVKLASLWWETPTLIKTADSLAEGTLISVHAFMRALD